MSRGPHPLPLLLALAGCVHGHDRAALAAFLQGVARYQAAPRPPPRPPGHTVARIGAVRLVFAGGPAEGPAILLVPSVINGGEVLDLLPGHSLVEALATRGHAVLRIDWGGLDRGERRLGLAGLVSARLVPLARRLPGRFAILGHCLGGTLALAAARLLPGLCRLVLLATPWHFAAYSAQRQAAAAWAWIEPLGRCLGAVPLAALNPLFWSLDPGGVAAKFRALGTGPVDPGRLRLFAAVEDWANGGPALPLAVARDIFVGALQKDLMARGRWRVGGAPVRPEALGLPILEIGARADRLVPPAVRPRWPGMRHLELEGGHVGILVGRRRSQLWDALAFELAKD